MSHATEKTLADVAEHSARRSRQAAIIHDVIRSLAPLAAVAPDSGYTDLGTLLRAVEFQAGTTEWDRTREALAGLHSRTRPDDLVALTVQYLAWWRDRTARRGEATPELLAAAIDRLATA